MRTIWNALTTDRIVQVDFETGEVDWGMNIVEIALLWLALLVGVSAFAYLLYHCFS